MGEPTRLGHYEVEMIAMDDQVAAAVGAIMDEALCNLDAAEMGAVVLTQKLVVIARHVDHAGAFARLTQQLLDDIVMSLGPIPSRSQAPTVDDVADQVDGIGVVMAQKVEKKVRLAPACAKMDVRNEEGAKVPQATFSHAVHLMFAESPQILESSCCD